MLFLALLLLYYGCASAPKDSATIRMPLENEFSAPCAKSVGPEFDVAFCPQWEASGRYVSGYRGFLLSIKNKTQKPIEIDWNKTYYITAGQTSGGFMFDGIIYKDRNNLKPNGMVLPSSEFLKTIFPNNLATLSVGRRAEWVNMTLPLGEQGAYITIVVDGKEVGTKLLTDIKKSGFSDK